jgi:kynureninase
MDAVLGWLTDEGVDPHGIHQHAQRLQQMFLDEDVLPGELTPGSAAARGNFLTFETKHAAELYKGLHDRGVVTDYRGDRLRIGFGVYQDDDDVDRLVEVLREVSNS